MFAVGLRLVVMWNDIFIALGLCLVFEGLLPALAPDRWRLTMLQAIKLPARVLRMMGMAALITGAVVVMTAAR